MELIFCTGHCHTKTGLGHMVPVNTKKENQWYSMQRHPLQESMVWWSSVHKGLTRLGSTLSLFKWYNHHVFIFSLPVWVSCCISHLYNMYWSFLLYQKIELMLFWSICLKLVWKWTWSQINDWSMRQIFLTSKHNPCRKACVSSFPIYLIRMKQIWLRNTDETYSCKKVCASSKNRISSQHFFRFLIWFTKALNIYIILMQW